MNSSPTVIRMINSRRMRWQSYIARMGRKGTHIGFWWESQKAKDHKEDLDLGGRTILTWILEE
jgi:hypothetical protein